MKTKLLILVYFLLGINTYASSVLTCKINHFTIDQTFIEVTYLPFIIENQEAENEPVTCIRKVQGYKTAIANCKKILNSAPPLSIEEFLLNYCETHN